MAEFKFLNLWSFNESLANFWHLQIIHLWFHNLGSFVVHHHGSNLASICAKVTWGHMCGTFWIRNELQSKKQIYKDLQQQHWPFLPLIGPALCENDKHMRTLFEQIRSFSHLQFATLHVSKAPKIWQDLHQHLDPNYSGRWQIEKPGWAPRRKIGFNQFAGFILRNARSDEWHELTWRKIRRKWKQKHPKTRQHLETEGPGIDWISTVFSLPKCGQIFWRLSDGMQLSWRQISSNSLANQHTLNTYIYIYEWS